MSDSVRLAVESPIPQGEDEQIAYRFDMSTWGDGVPSAPDVVLKDHAGNDISLTNLLGSASVSGAIITTPKVIGLTAGTRYRLEVQATIEGNLMEAYCEIVGEE